MNAGLTSVGAARADSVLGDVSALGASAGEGAQRLRRWVPELSAADPGGQLSALLEALAETAARLQDRCAELQRPAPARAPALAAAPDPAPAPAAELSTPALVALDLLAQGASRAEAEAHLHNFGVRDPRRVLAELEG